MIGANLRIRLGAVYPALPIATCLMATIVTGCAMGSRAQPEDAAVDGAKPDARAVDAPAHVTADAALDAPGCMISEGFTPTLDGTDDLAAYPTAQHVALGAMLGSDGAAFAWDGSKLYVTVTSNAFTGAYEPLHIYVEAGTSLAAAQPATGKEYSGLTPKLPFSPTHLIAVRRVSDSGTGGYDGVYVPTDGWMQRTSLLDSATLVSADQKTLSVSVPWSALGGCPMALRLAVHVVHAVSANEWKDLVPATHTPWQAPGGGYYEIATSGAPAVTNWSLH